MLGEVYALNTVIDEDRDLVFVNFGEIIASHLAAVDFVARRDQVPVAAQVQDGGDLVGRLSARQDLLPDGQGHGDAARHPRAGRHADHRLGLLRRLRLARVPRRAGAAGRARARAVPRDAHRQVARRGRRVADRDAAEADARRQDPALHDRARRRGAAHHRRRDRAVARSRRSPTSVARHGDPASRSSPKAPTSSRSMAEPEPVGGCASMQPSISIPSAGSPATCSSPPCSTPCRTCGSGSSPMPPPCSAGGRRADCWRRARAASVRCAALRRGRERRRPSVTHGGSIRPSRSRRRQARFDRASAGTDRGGAARAGNRAHAIAILHILAEAEAEVHGIALDEVHFHELADWDSLLDVVAAGSIAAALPACAGRFRALPRGGGLVATAAWPLPVPAPATALILDGFAWRDDGVRRRARHADRRRDPAASRAARAGGVPAAGCSATGTGAGTRALPGMPERPARPGLRAAAAASRADDRVAVHVASRSTT